MEHTIRDDTVGFPASTDSYDVRIIKIAVMPKGQPVFSELSTYVAIEDEAAGEFVKISQEGGHTDMEKWIIVNPEEWPAIRGAIDYMVSQCGSDVEE